MTDDVLRQRESGLLFKWVWGRLLTGASDVHWPLRCDIVQICVMTLVPSCSNSIVVSDLIDLTCSASSLTCVSFPSSLPSIYTSPQPLDLCQIVYVPRASALHHSSFTACCWWLYLVFWTLFACLPRYLIVASGVVHLGLLHASCVAYCGQRCGQLLQSQVSEELLWCSECGGSGQCLVGSPSCATSWLTWKSAKR